PLKRSSMPPQRQAIQHIICGEPAFAREPNSKPQILQTVGAMSIGIDDTLPSLLFGQRPPAPVQIEALWCRIELNPCTGARRRVQYGRDIDLVRFAFQQ